MNQNFDRFNQQFDRKLQLMKTEIKVFETKLPDVQNGMGIKYYIQMFKMKWVLTLMVWGF